MRKIIEYNILFNSIDVTSLTKIVNEQIKKGWEPLGSLTVQTYEHKIDSYNTKRVFLFYQVMIKYENSTYL